MPEPSRARAPKNLMQSIYQRKNNVNAINYASISSKTITLTTVRPIYETLPAP